MTMLEATSEANNRNALDLGLAAYKTKMATALGLAGSTSTSSGGGGGGSFLKESALTVVHASSLTAALELFDSVATMGSPAAIDRSREALTGKIEEERERYFELNALRNPFRDLELYTVPVLVAAAGWLAATAFDVACSSDACEFAEDTFEKVVSRVTDRVII
jgi:hypothetical protein